MKKLMHTALSDIYGKIVSIVMIATIPHSAINQDTTASIRNHVSSKYRPIFEVFDRDCKFTVLAYYNIPPAKKSDGPLVVSGFSDSYSIRFHPPLKLPDRSQNSTRLHQGQQQLYLFPVPSILKDLSLLWEYGSSPAPKAVSNEILSYVPPPIRYRTHKDQELSIISIDVKQFDNIYKEYSPSSWIQDRFTVLKGTDDDIILLETIQHSPEENPANSLIADHLAVMNELTIKPCPYTLVGGNILVVDSNCAFANITLHKGNIEAELPSFLGVQHICWIGELSNPFLDSMKNQCKYACRDTAISGVHQHTMGREAHIDMYITPGGKDSMGKEIIFVGRVEPDCIIGDIKDTIEAEKYRENLNNYLDTMANQIERCSPIFNVQRLPLVLDVELRESKQHYIVRTFNNCLIEVYIDKGSDSVIRHVYLPDYTYSDQPIALNRLAPIKAKVESYFRQYNFRPYWVSMDFINKTKEWGSLHCITKVLERRQ